MRILREDTVGLVIDIQERLFPHIYESNVLENNCIKLLSGLNVLEVPILITEQYTKGLGNTIPSLKEIIGNAYKPIEKLDFSCCGSDEFISKLKSVNKKNVILCGIESHICVLQTAVDLIENGYNPIIIEDCVGSRKTNDKHFAIARFLKEKCIVSTYESILMELCRRAKTEQFKEISKIIK